MNIFVLPGLDGARTMRQDFMGAFGDNYSLQLISYPENPSLDYRGLTKHAVSKLPPSEEYCIVAESFSGPVAIRIAESAGPNLRAIIFVSSFVRAPVPFGWVFSRFASLVPTSNSGFKAAAAKRLLGSRADNIKLRELEEQLASLPPELVRRRLSMLLQVDERKRLSKISVPMLYLQAREDRLVKRGAYRAMKRQCSHLVLDSIDGPHFLLGTKPLTCAEAVTKFLASL